MLNKQGQIYSHLEVFAFCVNATPEDDGENDFVHLMHLYKVDRFVSEDSFFPFGVRVCDKNENELTQTLYMQRFLYMPHSLN